MALLLDVWREASRHNDIGESIERIARLLPSRIPADILLVRRLDLSKKRVETVATGVCRGNRAPRQPRTAVSPADIPEILSWWRAGAPAIGSVTDRPLSLLFSENDPAQAIAVPLPQTESDTLGVMILITYPPRAFNAEHTATALQLTEPLAVALANHARFSELGQLREALEADKRALLTRLDRHDLTDTVVGSEAGLRGVLERVTQVAPTDAPVLILGETGTGKEVIARTIHTRSQRARAPVERVNCGALPPGLIDSELFGHERGSFTGAVSERKGWFERANGGTLFLDEVAELPLDAQVRLLRILQDGTYERVGGHQTRTVDVRIVAATHRDLHTMVAQGTFREDLWYRISVFPIRLPPLRERREDIPALVSHFAARAGRRLGGVPLTPSADDLGMVLEYDWPGNVRELAAVIERAVILGNGHHLDLAGALGTHHRTGVPVPAKGLQAEAWKRTSGFGPISTLDVAMAEHIAHALQITQGRIEGNRGAAVMLGINPHTLRARMRKLGLDWKRFRAVPAARAQV